MPISISGGPQHSFLTVVRAFFSHNLWFFSDVLRRTAPFASRHLRKGSTSSFICVLFFSTWLLSRTHTQKESIRRLMKKRFTECVYTINPPLNFIDFICVSLLALNAFSREIYLYTDFLEICTTISSRVGKLPKLVQFMCDYG